MGNKAVTHRAEILHIASGEQKKPDAEDHVGSTSSQRRDDVRGLCNLQEVIFCIRSTATPCVPKSGTRPPLPQGDKFFHPP